MSACMASFRCLAGQAASLAVFSSCRALFARGPCGPWPCDPLGWAPVWSLLRVPGSLWPFGPCVGPLRFPSRGRSSYEGDEGAEGAGGDEGHEDHGDEGAIALSLRRAHRASGEMSRMVGSGCFRSGQKLFYRYRGSDTIIIIIMIHYH